MTVGWNMGVQSPCLGNHVDIADVDEIILSHLDRTAIKYGEVAG
jgi:hypothetical protein